ncbi:hypothetical protein BGZ73_007844 [Actinomortierella ambigua]|nr:hypothetical protein BGZ73_007844 [Actinomortierella ambigua]
MKTFSTFLAAAIALLSSQAHAGPVGANPAAGNKSGVTIAIVDSNEFCFFLPPEWGGDIADNEHRAVAFCTKDMAQAPSANIFPTGFIKTANLFRNNARQWIQMTGRIDRNKYGLSKDDEGGQNDPKAPDGSKCAGYPYFVGLVEPNENIYCIRCCKNKSDCPTNRSEDGCRDVLPGDYS